MNTFMLRISFLVGSCVYSANAFLVSPVKLNSAAPQTTVAFSSSPASSSVAPSNESKEADDVPSLQQLTDWSLEYLNEVEEANGIISGFDKLRHWYDEDFIQTGPDIGPMNLQDYTNSLEYYKDQGFNFGASIPDLAAQYDGWHIDPKDPWRVWFVLRYRGTFTGEDLMLNGNTLVKANGQEIDGSPEVYSYVWTPEKKLKWTSIGFVGEKYTGTNKGYGGLVGLLVGMGVPKTILDLVYPLVQAQTWFSQFQGPGSNEGTRAPRTLTPEKQLPRWWRERKQSRKNLRL
mmetsp:Transcript_1268/g.1930  ORF Transcript_1268/g.1930 Transcript_1268/m.1930 type:complete len:289 (-) Transcript_1268:79-945(-)